MARVYIETSIISYLRQRPSGQVVAAARQLLTRRWRESERANFELVTSQYVIDKAGDGDPLLAQERLDSLDGIASLQLGPEIDSIARAIMSRAILPPKAQVDALHIATAAYHRIDYLLTWNCTPQEMLDDEANDET
jgi:predicted nucleic acid-binding protein